MLDIRTYLQDHVLIFDGAMGTYFSSQTNEANTNCELANLTLPNEILSIHHAYLEAGAKAIKTNTFAANCTSLEMDFLEVKKVIEAGYTLAKEAVGNREAFIFANIGPIFREGKEDLFTDYQEIVDAFLLLGATNFLFETFSEGEDLLKVAAYIKQKQPEAFILVEFAMAPDGYTRQGELGMALYQTFAEADHIDAVGFNCVSGPSHLLKQVKQLERGRKPLAIMPNAGYPTVINNRTYFDYSPEYFAKQMKEMVSLGVNIVGGCCGTTPKFISALSSELRDVKQFSCKLVEKQASQDAGVRENPNPILKKLQSGQKIFAVEVDPPLDANVDFFMDSARKLKELQIDLVTIADCPIARARVDSSLLACKLKRELNIEPLPHMTCRDRNINATKALLLGLSIEKIQNVLVVTGDPVPTAERNEVKGVFNFNSSVLANFIGSLNENVLLQPFLVYGALNINAKHFALEIKRAKNKIKHGVHAFLTQPALSDQAVHNLQMAKQELSVPILGGIMPIVSHRNACFMNNEISGITVSDEIVARYEGLDREEASRLAIEISLDMMKRISPYVDGFYLITPFKRIELITEIIAQAKSWGLF